MAWIRLETLEHWWVQKLWTDMIIIWSKSDLWTLALGKSSCFKAKGFGPDEEIKRTMWLYRGIHYVFLLLQPTVKSISLFSALTDENPLKGRLQIRLMSLWAGEEKREQEHRGDRENVLFSTHIKRWMQNTDEKNEQWSKNLDIWLHQCYKFMHDETSMGDLEL